MRTNTGPEQAIAIDRDQLTEAIREALNHLYDPGRLRNSPLLPLVGLAGRLDAAVNLRTLLIGAIESLEPEKSEPAGSPAWQTYEILYYRYVQRLSQAEVAEQVGVGERHIRRKQQASIETLADVIWRKIGLDSPVPSSAARPVGQASLQARLGTEVGPGDVDVEDELAWVEASISGGPSDLDRVLPALLGLAEPLAARHHTHVRMTIAEGLPKAAIGEMALRQVLLCLLTSAISCSSDEGVRLDASYDERETVVRIEINRRVVRARSGASPTEQPIVDLANRLAALCGSRLRIDFSSESFSSVLDIPVLGSTPILAVDDNPDTLQLLERYIAGSRYRLITTPDPERAPGLVRRFRPRVIVLDVMMPKTDGWEVLGRLREDPVTGSTPIIVSTILPQEDLATALGADAFLQKPVTREAFLGTLDGLIQASD